MSDSAQVYAKRVVCVVVLFWLLVYAGLLYVKAQEQDATYPQTKQWYVGVGMGAIRIVDTAGVCLYITADGVAAVPKTALKPGIGCQ